MVKFWFAYCPSKIKWWLLGPPFMAMAFVCGQRWGQRRQKMHWMGSHGNNRSLNIRWVWHWREEENGVLEDNRGLDDSIGWGSLWSSEMIILYTVIKA